MHHKFVLARVAKCGSAVGTDREYVETTNAEEAVRFYREGYEFVEGLCTEPCPICDSILEAIEEN